MYIMLGWSSSLGSGWGSSAEPGSTLGSRSLLESLLIAWVVLIDIDNVESARARARYWSGDVLRNVIVVILYSMLVVIECFAEFAKEGEGRKEGGRIRDLIFFSSLSSLPLKTQLVFRGGLVLVW